MSLLKKHNKTENKFYYNCDPHKKRNNKSIHVKRYIPPYLMHKTFMLHVMNTCNDRLTIKVNKNGKDRLFINDHQKAKPQGMRRSQFFLVILK